MFVVCFISSAQVKLSPLISDGMVLQRGIDVPLWGWAPSNQKIDVQFMSSVYSATADEKGKWSVVLPSMKAGGPYTMHIMSGDTVTIHDILVGDVWICSGQSNMELPMRRVSWNYPGEIAHSKNPNLRQFYVPRRYNFHGPQNTLSDGSWKSADPENTPEFSATAYFFGKALYDKYHVPIGLINSSLGGSPVEAWISGDSLKKYPRYYNEGEMFQDDQLIESIEQADRARAQAWYSMLWKMDKGNKDPLHPWYDPDLADQGWDSMTVPGFWADTKLGPINGVVWFRRNFTVPSSMADKAATAILGRIVDADSTFINGKFIGTISYQYPPSRFDVPAGLLKEGQNSIVVRVISNAGRGGFVPGKQYAIVAGGESIDLQGKWKYNVGAVMPPATEQTFIRWKPIGLYNGMIAPLLQYRMKGVIWYQGESNADNPDDYEALFKTMINDWRSKWNEGTFPFLFVQLPNYMEAHDQPTESNWALIREAQLKTLSLPKTAMAIAIDIGEWNDIHPLDKKDVGDRLALAAEHTAYGNTDVTYAGPIYKEMNITGSKVVITFTHTGSGLTAKGGGALKRFAIAGKDKKFVWANAEIRGNTVIVSSPAVRHPVAVRYAWADNPEGANLYNKEGLPASPFRTDHWK